MSRGAEGSEDPPARSPGAAGAELLPLLDELDVALVTTDLENRITRWEGAAERIFGFTGEEVIGRRSEELPIASASTAEIMRNALFSHPESPVEQDLQLMRRDGTSFPARVRFAARFGADGAIAGGTAVVLDSSTARRADDALPTVASVGPLSAAAGMALAGSDRAELLDRVIDLLVLAMGADLAAVVGTGAEQGEIVIEAGFGWQPQATSGEPLRLAPAEAAYLVPRGRPGVREVRASEIPPGGLLEGHSVRGGLCAPIGDPERPLGAVVAFYRSPRVYSQQETEFMRALGFILTAAAEHSRIRDLELRFHRASRMEAMGQLTGGIAHDFNNLLAVILNYANFAREEAEGDGQDPEASIAEIETAARRAAELTHQLLVFSRQEVVAVEPIDVAEAVGAAEGLLAVTLGETIELRTELVGGLKRVEAGRGQIEQIMVNLAVNSRDAMPDGGVLEISVAPAGERDPSYEWIRLIVRDDGAGMPRDVLEKAFEPFFTTKPVGQGSGFGLATVYGIVAALGGSVELRSEPGQGTTVDILLPVADADPGSEPHGTDPAEDAASGGRVLLVEDDEMVRRLTRRVLIAGGYEVVAADGPEQAMRLLLEDGHRFGVLLTDVVMPGTTGVELALRVRERVPAIRVVFMSGYTGESVPREAVREIEAGFVEKPFTPETLLACVEQAFGQL